MSSSKKNIAYSKEFKLKILEYYFRHGGDENFGLKSRTAQHFKIDKKTMSRMLCNPEMVRTSKILARKESSSVNNFKKVSKPKVSQRKPTPAASSEPSNQTLLNENQSSLEASNADKFSERKISVLDLPEDPDYSILKRMFNSSASGAAHIARLLVTATKEVQKTLLNECDLIFECKVCKNLFRSVVNFLAHKRIYCQDEFVHVKTMFSENNPIGVTSESSTLVVEPEPPPSTPPPSAESDPGNRSKINMIAEKLASNTLRKHRYEEPSSATHKGSSEYYESLQNAYSTRSQVTKNCAIVLKDITSNPSAVYQTFVPPDQDVPNRDMDSFVREIEQRKMGVTALLNTRGKIMNSCPGDLVSLRTEDLERMESCSRASSDCVSGQSEASLEQPEQVERLVYTCPICKITFLSLSGCYKHLYKIHNKKRHQRERLKQVICSRAFKRLFTQDEMKLHHDRCLEIKSETSKPKKVGREKRKAEPVEEKSSRASEATDAVVQSREGTRKQYVHVRWMCNVCNKKFISRPTSLAHIATHLICPFEPKVIRIEQAEPAPPHAHEHPQEKGSCAPVSKRKKKSIVNYERYEASVASVQTDMEEGVSTEKAIQPLQTPEETTTKTTDNDAFALDRLTSTTPTPEVAANVELSINDHSDSNHSNLENFVTNDANEPSNSATTSQVKTTTPDSPIVPPEVVEKGLTRFTLGQDEDEIIKTGSTLGRAETIAESLATSASGNAERGERKLDHSGSMQADDHENSSCEISQKIILSEAKNDSALMNTEEKAISEKIGSDSQEEIRPLTGQIKNVETQINSDQDSSSLLISNDSPRPDNIDNKDHLCIKTEPCPPMKDLRVSIFKRFVKEDCCAYLREVKYQDFCRFNLVKREERPLVIPALIDLTESINYSACKKEESEGNFDLPTKSEPVEAIKEESCNDEGHVSSNSRNEIDNKEIKTKTELFDEPTKNQDSSHAPTHADDNTREIVQTENDYDHKYFCSNVQNQNETVKQTENLNLEENPQNVDPKEAENSEDPLQMGVSGHFNSAVKDFSTVGISNEQTSVRNSLKDGSIAQLNEEASGQCTDGYRLASHSTKLPERGGSGTEEETELRRLSLEMSKRNSLLSESLTATRVEPTQSLVSDETDHYDKATFNLGEYSNKSDVSSISCPTKHKYQDEHEDSLEKPLTLHERIVSQNSYQNLKLFEYLSLKSAAGNFTDGFPQKMLRKKSVVKHNKAIEDNDGVVLQHFRRLSDHDVKSKNVKVVKPQQDQAHKKSFWNNMKFTKITSKKTNLKTKYASSSQNNSFVEIGTSTEDSPSATSNHDGQTNKRKASPAGHSSSKILKVSPESVPKKTITDDLDFENVYNLPSTSKGFPVLEHSESLPILNKEPSPKAGRVTQPINIDCLEETLSSKQSFPSQASSHKVTLDEEELLAQGLNFGDVRYGWELL